MARPNQPDVVVGWFDATPGSIVQLGPEPSSQESLPEQRLIQSSLHESFRWFTFLFSELSLLGFPSQDEAVVPGAILVAVAVGRFAKNRSPPTSRWANAVTIQCDPPGPRLWWGQRWRAIRGKGREWRKGPLALFFELEPEGATRGLSCGCPPGSSCSTTQARRWASDGVGLLVR